MSIELLESDVAVISRICGRIFNRLASWIKPYFGVHAPPEAYLPITHAWFAAELSQWRTRWLCKQRGQTARIWLKTLLMPRLAVCSRDLHWHWINWTLLCDTMEVSMLRLAWLPIAQHVFQPALTGRLELISRKIVSREQEQRLSRWADFAKNCLPRIECKELQRFHEKYPALGPHVCKIREIGGQKNGVQHATAIYIQFRDIHDRDISGLHCILIW